MRSHALPSYLPICLLLASTAAVSAAPNENTTFVLHAVQTNFGPCEIQDPCGPGPGPTVEITQPGQPYAIYFLVRNFDAISSLQADLQWPADWTYGFAISCPPNPLDCFHVGPHTILCTFNCITGGATTLMAVIQMVAGSGCFEIVDSIWPYGTHVLDCQMIPEPVPKANRGRVCVGPGGINACASAVPVLPKTWGLIKSQYR